MQTCYYQLILFVYLSVKICLAFSDKPIDSDGDDFAEISCEVSQRRINQWLHYKIRGFVATRFDNYFCYVLVHLLGIRWNRQQTIVTWMSFLAGKTNTAMSNNCIVTLLTHSRQEGST